MARPSRFSPEVRERAVRMVFEHAQNHASRANARRLARPHAARNITMTLRRAEPVG